MVDLWIVFLVKIRSIGMYTKKESYEGDENSQENKLYIRSGTKQRRRNRIKQWRIDCTIE